LEYATCNAEVVIFSSKYTVGHLKKPACVNEMEGLQIAQICSNLVTTDNMMSFPQFHPAPGRN
jgi:hypothetical protein